MSDLLYSIFWSPTRLSLIHSTNLWLVGDRFGQALCKLVHFADVSIIVSIQNLVLITVDRFVAVVFPLRSPLIRSKLCPFFILGTWIVAAAYLSPYFYTYQLVEYAGKRWCPARRKKAFGTSSSLVPCRLPLADYYILGRGVPHSSPNHDLISDQNISYFDSTTQHQQTKCEGK